MMTSNRPLEDWGKLIGDVPSATAILDHFLHHAKLIQITGKSYRLRNRANANLDVSDTNRTKKGKIDQSAHPVESGDSTGKLLGKGKK